MAGQFSFPGVTLMITHYNRSGSLERLLNNFSDLGLKFDEIVVADDHSRTDQLDSVKALQTKFPFRLVVAEKNGNIAANINLGQDAVRTPYTLYVQEDFIPTELFAPALSDALTFLNQDKDLDLVRFWAHYRYPTLKPYGKGFSEMKFSETNMSHLKFFQYSDTPHLRRTTFFNKFGRYKEGVSGDVGEYLMAVAFLQNKGKGLFFENYSTLLTHENPSEEPSTQGRATWRQKRNPALLFLRFLYLRFKWLKCTLDVKFKRLDTAPLNK